MSFSPGQFITAQRLNRLQPRTYFVQASGTTSPVVSNGDVTGASTSITVETNGAKATFMWTAAVYATGAMASNTNTQAYWDVNGSPTFALAQWATNGEKGTVANVWDTTISTAGTYTFKLKTSVVANSQLAIYTSMVVMITEVA